MSEPEESSPPPPADDNPDLATTFDEAHDPGTDDPPPQDETLPHDEKSAIAKQREDLIASNSGRSEAADASLVN
jgi:hypothetical protein